jgi:hypothetical protein
VDGSTLRAPRPATIRAAAVAACLSAACFAAGPAASRPAPPPTAAAADSLVLEPPSPARRRAFSAWATKAALGDLVWILRRPAAELGDLEIPALEAALRRTPAERAALGSRLVSRLALSDAGRARGRSKGAPQFGARELDFPWSSVFRVGVLLPDSGAWREESRALLLGVELGLAARRRDGLPAAEVEFYPLADERPATVAAAFDWAASRCGSLIGGLLDPAALVLGTSARLRGIPLVLPGATDEEIGTLGRPLWQIGPSGWERGAALAGVALAGRRPRVGLLVAGSGENHAFVDGFAAACEAAGAEIVFRECYARGNTGFASEIRALVARKVELLFWDGDAREAAALLRQLMRERVSLPICGGEALAPERHHREARLMLEGVQYAAEEWTLAEGVAARVDSLVRARTGEEASPAHVRGWLAGSLIGEAIAGGALAPGEVDDAIAAHRAAPAWLRDRRFADPRAFGAGIAVYEVNEGVARRR